MSNNFSTYANLGLSVFPLRGKHPLVAWKRYQDAHADQATIEMWDNTPHNIGVATGHISELLVVDVDGEYPADWPEMPETWTVKTKKGYHYYFFMPVDANYRNSTKSPSDCIISEIPQWLHDVLVKHDKRLFETPVVETAPVAPVAPVDRTDSDQAYIDAAIKDECDLLRNAPSGCRNDQLNKSSFALAGLVSAAEVENILTPIALEIGQNQVETRKTIQSGCESATKRTIPARARMPEPEAPDDMPLIVKNILERNGKTVSHSEISPDLISGATGMLGGVIRYSLRTSLYPQPVLGLAAAIPCVGNIMAHRVCTETDLRTNFFTMGIAESGAGKDHARRCVARIYSEAGLSESLTGDPASATAVIAAVKRSDGRALMQIDEMGRFLKSLGGNNAASHNRMVTTNMMHMYNNASDMYTGQEYANNELNGGRSDIDQPCLNIYGTTVPHNFYGSLTSEEAYDGFLSRWLIFETTRFDIEPAIDRADMKPPEDLMEDIRGWIEQPTFYGGADGGFGHHTMIKPRVVEFAPDARNAFYALIRDCRVKMSKSDHPIDKAFWNRCAEHSAKLALVGHEGDVISKHVLDWAVELSRALTVATIENIKANVSDNAYEAELQNVFKLIKLAKGGMSKSELTRKTQRIERRKRQDIIETLIEGGDIREVKTDNGKGKALTSYHV